jgi:hypothetical protein
MDVEFLVLVSVSKTTCQLHKLNKIKVRKHRILQKKFLEPLEGVFAMPNKERPIAKKSWINPPEHGLTEFRCSRKQVYASVLAMP